MYFRQKKTASGTILQLIQSYRTQEGKPRQRIIASLGDAQIDHNDRKVIAHQVELKLSAQEELIPTRLSTRQQEWVDRIINLIQQKGITQLKDLPTNSNDENWVKDVDISKVSHTKGTSAGAELLGLHAWDTLELSQALKQVGFNDAQIRAAQASVINRLVEPVSEHALQSWLRSSSLPDLLMESFSGKRIEGRFYRVSDLLYQNSEHLESHLRQKQLELFGSQPSVFLYDLTNTYFEGSAEGNEEAIRGKSKEKRSDCPLISIAIAFSSEGLPIAHRLFAGNQNDGASFPEALEQLEQLCHDLFEDNQTPLFIMDAGLSTKKNLRLLREKGYDYLVCMRRSVRNEYQDIFADKENFEQIEDKEVYVRKQTQAFKEKDPDSGEVEKWEDELLFCYSEQRSHKEESMLQKQTNRFHTEMKQLQKSILEGNLKQEDKVLQRIGRIKQRCSRVSRFFEFKLDVTEEGKRKKKRTVKSLSWEQLEQYDQQEDLAGCYVMRSSRKFDCSSQMWNLYMSLTNAEDGFRCLKSDLGVRPINHQTKERCRAHIFISVLALHLLCFLKKQLAMKGETRSWSSLKLELDTHTYTTMIIPTKTDVYHIRKLGDANSTQNEIYEKLGIDLNGMPMTKTKIKK